MNDTSENYIAITGMSCRFAGCENLKAYWRRLLTAAPAFSTLDDNSAKRYLLEDSASFRNITTLNGGYLGDLWRVKSTSLTIPQNAINGTNPEVPLACELALQAFKDSGAITSGIPHDRVGVIVGYSPIIDPATVALCQHGLVVDQTMELIRKCFPHGTSDQFETLRKSIIASLPQYDSRNISSMLHHTLASTIAERCDITGESFCVDMGAVSSAIALEHACDSLAQGRIDLALAGGIQGLISPPLLMLYSRFGYLSKSGTCHPFGQGSDGTLPGEGGGFVVLKRLRDAIRDKDRVYAIVKCGGIASDGNAKRPEGGIALAIRNAWRKSPLDADTIEYVEANGTGVAALDKAELKVIAASLNSRTTLPRKTIALGASKSLIGHTIAAAGIAGVIKAALALYHRIIPPECDATHPMADAKFADTPFYLNPHPRPWVHNDAGAARRAAISSFTVGGAAAYIVLEQST